MDEPVKIMKREVVATIVVLLVIAGIVTAVAITNRKKTITATNTAVTTSTDSGSGSGSGSGSTSTSNDTSTAAPVGASVASTYTDGTYTGTGSYESPGGEESITVKVTLKGDVITATSATSGAQDPEAQEYQSDFIAGYKQLVIGKTINSVKLSRVSGSSLTSQGFNDAIKQIENQAKA